jgi:hypothetical protein
MIAPVLQVTNEFQSGPILFGEIETRAEGLMHFLMFDGTFRSLDSRLEA